MFRVVKNLSKSGKQFSELGNNFLQIRLISGLQTQIPQRLSQNVEQYLEQNPTLLPSSTLIKKGSKTMLKTLKNFLGEDAQEAQNFLEVLSQFKEQGNKFLIIENTPTNPDALKMLSDLLIGVVDDRLIKSSEGRITETGVLSPSRPHTDGSRFNINVAVTILGGITANGDGVTTLYDLENLYSKLASSSKAILEQPIFGYAEGDISGINDFSNFSQPILYRDQNGILKANFSYDMKKSLVYDSEKTDVSDNEINLALNELHEVVLEAMKSDNREKLRITSGSIVLLKNRELLHEKLPGFTPEIRDVYFASYVPEDEQKIVKSNFLLGANNQSQR